MSRSVFSQSWHYAAELKPRLLPHARFHPHTYRGKKWFVLQDSTGGRYHRLSVGAYGLVSRMNGMLTVQNLWDDACRAGGDSIPTQDEVVELLMQLHSNDLLQCDITPDSAELFERFTKRKKLKWKHWITQPMSLRIPLINPNEFLSRWVQHFAWLFTRNGALLWLSVVLPAIFLAGQNWSELTLNLSDHVLSTSNLLVLAFVYPIVKAIHELGHGFATKVWGGSVHEMGLMFLMFSPVPYVDASAASAFRSKQRRIVVGAAGMLAEVFLAALAMYLWVLVEPGIVRAVVFNIMLIAGVSTVIVNGNPLLRYDGYYILADLIEIPNLAQRGQHYLSYLTDRYLLGAKELTSPEESLSEKRWLVGYTISSWLYRIFVTISIIIFIGGKFFIFGVVLAIMAAIGLFFMPIWKSAKHLLKSTTLHRHRAHAIKLSVVLVGVFLLFGFFFPIPLRTETEGVVWLPEQALVRANVNGLFQHWLVSPGAQVSKGTALLVMANPQLDSDLAVARAKVAEAEARYSAEQFDNPVQASVLFQQMQYEQRSLERIKERYGHLIIYSKVNGVLVVPKSQDMAGQYFKKGDLLGYLMDRHLLVARVAVTQDNIDLVRTRLKGVELRFSDAIADTYPVSILREIPSALDELPTAALSPIGGGHFSVDPNDSKGLKTIDKLFFVDLSLPLNATPNAFGERVYVRFDHFREPLFNQLQRRLRQLFLSRFHV